MKYSKIKKVISEIFIGSIFVILILTCLASIVAFAAFDAHYSNPGFSLLWFMILPFDGWCTNRLLGHFFGDEIYNTGEVYEGRTVFSVRKTPKFYSRKMFYCFAMILLFAVLIVRFISLINVNVCAIIGIVASVITMILYYIAGMSAYEHSSIKKIKT